MTKEKNGSTETTPVSSARAGADGKKNGANPSPNSGPDDLKQISGIGPSVERKLHKAGITTFAQIAAMSDAELKKMEAILKVPGGVDWDAWKNRARAFMTEDQAAKKQEEQNPAPVDPNPHAGADKGGAGDPPVSGSVSPSAQDTGTSSGQAPAEPQERAGKGDGIGDASPSADENTQAATEDEDDSFGAAGYFVVVKTAKKIKSRRRAGRSFSPEETLIPSDELRRSEFGALDGDPALELHLQDIETGEIIERPE